MKYPISIAILIILGAAGCEKSSTNERGATSKAESEGDQTTELALAYYWKPSSQHEKMESSEIGSDLDDAVRVLGRWDPVGDVISDAGGLYYPFSNRGGYDYIVQIGENSSINGVWRWPEVISER